MLSRISIANLATIERLSLEFDDGFTVLTGETGAGKSILIDGLRLVLGAKGSADLMRSGAEQTVVEAEFRLDGIPEVRERLEALGVPHEGELVLRRVLQANGRSRALANDCNIALGSLEELADYLVNIHGQHDNQMLLRPANHIHFLDRFGALMPQREQVSGLHARYSELLKALRELEEAAESREQRRETLAQEIETIRAAALEPGEDTELAAEHARLTHAERLIELTEAAGTGLYEGEEAIYSALGRAIQALREAAALDPALEAQAGALDPARIQIEETARALASYRARLEPDPNRLDWLNERLALIEKLSRRYGGSVEAVLATLEAREAELASLETADESREALAQERDQVAGRLHRSAQDLSTARQEVASGLDREVMEQLRQLGMEKAVFETRIAPRLAADGRTPAYGPLGGDEVEFLLSSNPGQKPRALSRIASGGELSRIMLALKSVLAKADPTATLVFDEVDAGVSGATAEMVGRKLRGLGASHQVFCVTHLPQIAALGTRHVRVTKSVEGDQTYTRAEALDGNGKVQEVARLLSGIEMSDHSVRSAEEMVQRGQRPPL